MYRECVAACIHAYQCLLFGHTVKVPTVFVFLLQQSTMLNWKGNAGNIDTGATCGCVKSIVSTACQMKSFHNIIFNLCQTPPAHAGSYRYVWKLINLYFYSLSQQCNIVWSLFSTPTTNWVSILYVLFNLAGYLLTQII